MRVDQQAALGRHVLGSVVINDQHVDRLVGKIGHLVVGVCAAIEGDEEAGFAALQGPVDGASRESVSVLRPAGDDEGGIQPKSAEDGYEERRAADAVDII